MSSKDTKIPDPKAKLEQRTQSRNILNAYLSITTTRTKTTMMECSSSPAAALEGETDTDKLSPEAKPIHFKAKRITLPPLSSVDGESGYVAVTDPDRRPKLTLSAFRRPEHTVRLTRSDPARRLEDEYDQHSPGCGILGHGAFSTVHLARRNHDNLKVAIKSIAKHDALRARRLRSRRGSRSHLDEWEILQEMRDHPNIVTLLDVFETDEEIHLVTEFCEGGELFDAIQKKRMRSPSVQRGHYSEPQAACITRQLLTALRDLHAKGIMHRDLKPENIVLDTNDDSKIHAKIIDFGQAKVFDRETGSPSASDVETPPSTPGKQQRSFCAVSCDYYAAPEVCAAGSAHRPSADIYSLGVTLYILLCGFPPVFSDEELSDEDYVLFPEVQWSSISLDAKQLIRKMLHPDPARRITAECALCDGWILHHVSHASSMHASNFTRKTLNASCLNPEQQLSRTLKSERVNLEQVRDKLYQSMARLNKEEPGSARKRRGSDVIVSPKRKRRRSLECHRRSSIVCAMKELYNDMASVSAAASAAAAGVTCDEGKRDVHVYNEELGYEDPDEKRDASPFKSSRAAVPA